MSCGLQCFRVETLGIFDGLVFMNPLHFCIIVTPLSVYLLLLGFLNLRGRPFVTTVGRDIAILGVAISGLVVIGPMELFFPETAVARFGPFVWIMLLAFYGLCTSMIALLVRPGLVIYNVSYDQLRPVLTDVLTKMGKPQWMGDNVRIPTGNIHFHIENHPWLRTIQLVSSGNRQNFNAWRELEIELGKASQTVPSQANFYGPLFLVTAAVLMVGSLSWMILDQDQVMVALRQMMRR